MQDFFPSIFSIAVKWFSKPTALEIYTDGSCKRGIGSWAYVILQPGRPTIENSGREKSWDSNFMEFQAAIEALSSSPIDSKITLYSDSRILVDAMKSGKGPPAFQVQIDLLLELSQGHCILWRWVKAHSGNDFNERCDELCTLARSF